jgi:ferrous iron transport protein A
VAERSNLERLSELAPGRRAVIESLDASGPIGRRLLDLGLLPGTPVRALRKAPLGDPTVFELRGYRLCLRRSESGRVRVRTRDHTKAPTHTQAPIGP